MINNKLVHNYTSALFDNALAGGLEDEIFKQISIVNHFVNGNLQIRYVILSPIVKRIDKCKIVELITEAFNIEPIVKQFLLILLRHSSMPILPNIVVLYQRLLNKSRNIKMLEVTFCKSMHSREKEWLIEYLETKFQQKIAASFKQNRSIIGGITIQYDSILMDYSLAGVLKKIMKTLKATKICSETH